MDLGKFYQTQISLTEWLEKIGFKELEGMRVEDYEKRERLKVLNRVIKLPFDKPIQFSAEDICEENKVFMEYYNSHSKEFCALRLNPLRKDLPKERIRGSTLEEAFTWFKTLKIDKKQYRADIVPHAEVSEWSTIFVVNQKGIFGEIIRGGHHQLSQGFYEQDKPITFSYDFTLWQLSSENEEALTHLKEIVKYLHVEKAHQSKLQEELQATFAQNYLEGYFETSTSKEFGVWFIDYNRILGEMFQDFAIKQNQTKKENNQIVGNSAFAGVVRGKVRVIDLEKMENSVFEEKEILVCTMTTPHLVPLMQKASAIITDKGGILSHAAIVSRELKIPCVVGAQNATSLLKTGDVVEVDANTGIIRKLQN